MNDTLLWILAIGLMLVGVLGTVLPALPGVILVLAGIVLGAWIDDFQRVSVTTVVIIGVLAVIAWSLDFVAGLLGAKRVGASRLAIIGAALGTVVGLFMGLVGVLFMPFVGAALGEWWSHRQKQANISTTASTNSKTTATQQGANGRALQVGFATWLGLMVGLISKVVIVFLMLGIFIAAVWR